MNACAPRRALRHIPLAGIAPQAWRNGGGRTRELLSWPSGEGWLLRISEADIEVDGPFSDYPGVERWFAVIEGAGVSLTFADGARRLMPGDPPLCFDGAAAPHGRLLAGSTRDLNLMCRHGRGAMRQAQPEIAWDEAYTMRGLFTAVAGLWSDANEHIALPASTLLWDAATGPTAWTFEPAASGPVVAGWWLGFTPQGSRP